MKYVIDDRTVTVWKEKDADAVMEALLLVAQKFSGHRKLHYVGGLDRRRAGAPITVTLGISGNSKRRRNGLTQGLAMTMNEVFGPSD